jgi:signal peptidase I
MAAIDGWESLVYALLTQRLVSGGCVRLTITSASMAPLLLPGDSVLLARVPVAALGVGDLVALAAEPCPIVHRIVAASDRWGKQSFVTKGDAGTTYDRQFLLQAVLGRVLLVQRTDKVLTLTTHTNHYGARILARLSCLCAGTASLPSYFLRRVTFFLLRRTMYIVASVVWCTGQRPPGC